MDDHGLADLTQHAVINLAVIVGATAEFGQRARGHQDDPPARLFDRRDLFLIGTDHVVDGLGIFHREVVGAGAGKHQRVAFRLCRLHRTLDQFERSRPVQPHATLRGVHGFGHAKAEVPDVLAERNGPVPIDRRCQPRIGIGQRIGHHMRRGKRDAVQGAFEFRRKRSRRRQAIGLDPAIGGRQFQCQRRDRQYRLVHDFGPLALPHTLIGATSIHRRSRQLCNAHSASCTPLAPSSSVYL